jgi:DNA-binding winged helix-turn-helix (wHTH) protein/Tfp pilus assembly protein PilF
VALLGQDGSPDLLVFGPFTLDAFSRTLESHERAVVLQPKTFELLTYLARNGGRLIGKDELFDALWPGEDVGEANLSQQMFLLRGTLARYSPRTTYIVTEPGRGYRFVARVSLGEPPGAPRDAEAHRLYARGRYFYEKRTADSLHRSIYYFRRAIAADERFGRAYAGLASAHVLSGEYLLQAPTDAFPSAARAARTALELDGASSEAYLVLGDVACHYARDFAAAERHYVQATALAPRGTNIAVFHAWFLCLSGRAPEALEILLAAAALEPYSLVLQTTVAVATVFLRRYDEAVQQLRAVLDMDPEYVHARYYLAMALQLQQRYADVVELCSAPVPDGYEQQFLALGGHALARLGRDAAAREASAAISALGARGRYVSTYNLAYVALGLRELDEALALVARGLEERDPWVVFVAEQPKFEELRAHPGFAALAERIRTPAND